MNDDPFLLCREWRVMRMRALERDGAKCACCGRTAHDGVIINVDHIKPRARHPEMALDLANLQVLCNECNHGKGNVFETQWRRESPSRPSRPILRRPPSRLRVIMRALLTKDAGQRVVAELDKHQIAVVPDTPEGAAFNDLLAVIRDGASYRHETTGLIVGQLIEELRQEYELKIDAEAVLAEAMECIDIMRHQRSRGIR